MGEATERLRAMLDELGVEWTACDGEYVKETRWPYMGELTAAFSEYYDGTTRFACDTWCFTPEQAIAATLGNDAAYTRDECEAAFVRGYSLGLLPAGSEPQWDENRQTVDEHMAELGWIRAVTLGSGKLTAEQVREAWCGNLRRDCLYDPPKPDWQAIADELNDTLGKVAS